MNEDLAMRLSEDRALRDSAKALVKADLAHVKADLSGKSVQSRVSDRVSEGALDLFEEGKVLATENKEVLAGLGGALVLLLAGVPLVRWLFSSNDDEPDYDDDDDYYYEEQDDEDESRGRLRSLFGF